MKSEKLIFAKYQKIFEWLKKFSASLRKYRHPKPLSENPATLSRTDVDNQLLFFENQFKSIERRLFVDEKNYS